MVDVQSIRYALSRLNGGGVWFYATVLRREPAAVLLDSKSSPSFAAMKEFRTRSASKVNVEASGRLWANAWCRDRGSLDEAIAGTESEHLLDACTSVYEDLYAFAGLPELREALDAFIAPSTLLRALDAVQCRPGLDLGWLERLPLPVARVRALNLMDDVLDLPEAVLAVEASLRASERKREETLRLWAEAARVFLAVGLPEDECVELVARTGWRSLQSVYENRSLPQEYWESINAFERTFE